MGTVSMSISNHASARTWGGRLLTAIPVLFLLFDGTIKVLQHAEAVKAFEGLGYPVSALVAIGALELLFIALFLVRRTAIIGAVLLTAFLGGAVASHVRVGDPLFTHILFPVYVAAMIWGGQYLRDERVRALVR